MRYVVGSLLLVIGGAAVPAEGALPTASSAVRSSATELDRLQAVAEAADNDGPVAVARKAWEALLTAASHPAAKGGAVHPAAGRALAALAAQAQAEGRNEEAERLARQALPILRAVRDTEHNYYTQALSIIAWVQAAEGRPTQAAETLGEATAFSRAYITALAKAPDAAVAMASSNLEYTLGQVQTRLGNLDAASEAYRTAWGLRRTAFGNDNPDAIASRWNYALALLRAGRERDAEIEARAAVAQSDAHVSPEHPTYTRTIEALALILSRVGRRAEAAALAERSLDVKRRTIGTAHVNYFAGLTTYADIALQRERYGDSRTAYLEAAAGYRKLQGEASFEALRATLMSGVAGYAAGDAAARPILENAVAALQARDPKERRAVLDALPALVLAREDANDRPAAHALAVEYRAIVASIDRKLPSVVAEAQALVVLTAPREAAWREQAIGAAERTIAAVREEGWLARSGDLSLRARAALEVALRLAVESDAADTGLGAMTILTASRIASASRALDARLQSRDAALGERVRALQTAGEFYRSSDSAWLRALAAGQKILPAVIERRDSALRAVDTARATLVRENPDWVDASGRGSIGVDRVRAALLPEQAVLGIVPSFRSVFVAAITRGAAVIERVAVPRGDAEALVATLRTELSGAQPTSATAAAIGRILLPPAILRTIADARALRIVAADAFAALPYAMLQFGDNNESRSALWIDRFALSTGALFAPPRGNAVAAQGAAFLGIGAPTPFGAGTPMRVAAARTYFRGSTADATALAALPPLPGSDRELRTVARSFSHGATTVLAGNLASEDALATIDLTRFSTILFATHGLVGGEMDGVVEPALVLAKPAPGSATDGLLTASEIAQLRLDADWVILSACNTAAGSQGDAPTFSGLAQSFRQAGARALLLSHWPVRDDIAARMTISMVRDVRSGRTHADALRRAMLAERARGNRDPFLWASFVLAE